MSAGQIGSLLSINRPRCVSVSPRRPRGRRRLQGAGAQLPPVLPLPLHAGSAPGAAVLAAGGPRCAGAGRHRGGGRQHPYPLLPGHLWAPGAAEQQEHLRPVRWVGFAGFFFGVGVSCDWSRSLTSHLLGYITFRMQFVFVIFSSTFFFFLESSDFVVPILDFTLGYHTLKNIDVQYDFQYHANQRNPQIGHVQNKRHVMVIERIVLMFCCMFSLVSFKVLVDFCTFCCQF